MSLICQKIEVYFSGKYQSKREVRQGDFLSVHDLSFDYYLFYYFKLWSVEMSKNGKRKKQGKSKKRGRLQLKNWW